MSLTENLARLDASLRPLTMHLPASLTTSLYSGFRRSFLHRFTLDRPKQVVVPVAYSQVLWGLRFRAPLFNAAGMFKNGEGYEVVSRQGAGAYIAGTTTATARMGNTGRGIDQPFVPYPHSASASNWLGLPNRGHSAVAAALSRVTKQDGCPLGASVSSDPLQQGLEALGSLVEGMFDYERAGVDFLELNESCPNVADAGHRPTVDELDPALIERLEYVRQWFLHKRSRPLPLIVKISNDTNPDLIPALVELLVSMDFDGLNVGNTSTRYDQYLLHIDKRDKSQYEYFTKHFGGGLSGRILKSSSMILSNAAAQHARSIKAHNFHVIRTGGVETMEDILQSHKAGVALCQWYTAYFESFSCHGHQLYAQIFNEQNATSWSR